MIKSISLGDTNISKAYLGSEIIYSSSFDPLDLFAGGKQGIWLDPSDLSTMFQNVGGASLPVTKDGDPVGLILDKSQGLEDAVTNVAKPFKADSSNEYLDVTNTSDGTKLVIKQLSNQSTFHVFEVDKTYKLSVVYSMPETASDIGVVNTSSGASNFLFTATKGVRNKAEVTLTARSTALYFRTDSGEITIHEIVLKEIKGNHASQSLAASRPTYRTDGVLHWLQFDGVDDELRNSVTLGNNSLLSAAVSSDRPSNSFVFGEVGRSAKIGLFGSAFFRLVTNGDSVSIPYVAASKYIITGFRDNGYTSGRLNKVESKATAPNATAQTTWITFGSANSASQYFSGSIYGAILLDDYSANKLLKIENYLSAKSGVTL